MNLKRKLVSFKNRGPSIRTIFGRSLLKKNNCKRKYINFRKTSPVRSSWFSPLKKILSLWINLWRKGIKNVKNINTKILTLKYKWVNTRKKIKNSRKKFKYLKSKERELLSILNLRYLIRLFNIKTTTKPPLNQNLMKETIKSALPQKLAEAS